MTDNRFVSYDGLSRPNALTQGPVSPRMKHEMLRAKTHSADGGIPTPILLSPSQNLDNQTSKQNDEESDYMDMTPKHMRSSSSPVVSYKSRIFIPAQSNQLQSDHGLYGEMNEESVYADMSGGGLASPNTDFSSYSIMKNGKAQIKRHRSARIVSPLRIPYSSRSFIRPPRSCENQSLIFDYPDGSSGYKSSVRSTGSVSVMHFREGSFNKDDDDDYDDVCPVDTKSISPLFPTNQAVMDQQSPQEESIVTSAMTNGTPVTTAHKSDGKFRSTLKMELKKNPNPYKDSKNIGEDSESFYNSEPFRKRSENLSFKGKENSVSTAAGKAARKILLTKISSTEKQNDSQEMKRSASSGIIRSSSRVGKTGGVQNRISRFRNYSSTKHRRQEDMPPIEHSTSLTDLKVNNVNIDKSQLEAREIRRKKSLTLDANLRIRKPGDEDESLLEAENGLPIAESFHKGVGKGRDGAQMMKYISYNKRSQSLDKDYMEWLRKTTPFALRTASTTSTGTDSDTPPPSRKSLSAKFPSSDNIMEGRKKNDDQKLEIEIDEEEFRNFLETNTPVKTEYPSPTRAKKNLWGLFKDSSKVKATEKEEEASTDINKVLSTRKSRKMRKSIKLKSRKKTESQKGEREDISVVSSLEIDGVYPSTVVASGNNEKKNHDEDDSIVIGQQQRNTSISSTKSAQNYLLTTDKPPISPRRNDGSLDHSCRSLSSSASMLAVYRDKAKSKSKTFERGTTVPQILTPMRHKRNKSDMPATFWKRGAVSTSILNDSTNESVNDSVLDISLASNYDDDDDDDEILQKVPSKNKFNSPRARTLGRFFFSKKSKDRKSVVDVNYDNLNDATSPSTENKRRVDKSLSLEEERFFQKLTRNASADQLSQILLSPSQKFFQMGNLVQGFLMPKTQSGHEQASADSDLNLGGKKARRLAAKNKYATISGIQAFKLESLKLNLFSSSPKIAQSSSTLDISRKTQTNEHQTTEQHTQDNCSKTDPHTADMKQIYVVETCGVDHNLNHRKKKNVRTLQGISLLCAKEKFNPLYKKPNQLALKVAVSLFRCIKATQPNLVLGYDDIDDKSHCLTLGGSKKDFDELVQKTYAKGNDLVTWLQELIDAKQKCDEEGEIRPKSNAAPSRWLVSGMWQVLFEEGIIYHNDREEQFEDAEHYYVFHDDVTSSEELINEFMRGRKRDSDDSLDFSEIKSSNLCPEESNIPSPTEPKAKVMAQWIREYDMSDVLSFLQKNHHDAMFRKALRQRPDKRNVEELAMIYDEIIHIKALSHLSNSVKRQLAGVLKFEFHQEPGETLFKQGDEGTSWYIILRGSVKVDILGKGVVCTLQEGDDFGNLAIVNEAPRAATIIFAEANCHFMRVDKQDFIRILKDVEDNTVRLKEHEEDVLVLEKIRTPSESDHRNNNVIRGFIAESSNTPSKASPRYSITAGTPERILEHVIDNIHPWNPCCYDETLEDFILMHPTFMKSEVLCRLLLKRYRSEDETKASFGKSVKRKVVYFVVRWSHISTYLLQEQSGTESFLKELEEEIDLDCNKDATYLPLKEDFSHLYRNYESDADLLQGNETKKNYLLIDESVKRFQIGGRQLEVCSPVKANDAVLMKIYNSEKSYATVKFPVISTADEILKAVARKMNKSSENMKLMEIQECGDVCEIPMHKRSVATSIGVNSYLCICTRKEMTDLEKVERLLPTTQTFPLDTISSVEIAYQVAQHDWELVRNVHPMEYVYKVFGAHKFQYGTPNLDVLARRFNQLAYWPPTEICSCNNVNKRAQLLRKFIKIAQHLKLYQNLNAFMAVTIGIGNQAVSRLSSTWEKLPAKYKKLLQEYEAILDPSRNHRAYRVFASSLEPPVIPYLPLLMKDMTFQHEGNESIKNHLVNFEKMRMLSGSVRSIIRGCSAKIEGDCILNASKSAEDTKRYVQNIHVITDQKTLNELSNKLEPKR